MDTDLDLIYAESLENLRSTTSTTELEEWYRETLSRKGRVYLLTRQVGHLSPEERPVFGKRLNQIKQDLQAAYDGRLAGNRKG